MNVENKLRKLVSDDVWELLENYNCMIAGGAITSLFTNKEVNDLDIYFRTPSDFKNFIYDLYGECDDVEIADNIISPTTDGNWALRVMHITNKSVLSMDTFTQQYVQLIMYKFFETPEEIFNVFDFSINMGVYDIKSKNLTLHENFLLHNSQRYLDININTSYPMMTAMRITKYLSKGYTISKPQYLKLLVRISELKIKSWHEFKEHVGGMYGLELSEVFPKDIDVDGDEGVEYDPYIAMEILGSMEVSQSLEDPSMSSVSFEQILEKYKDLFDSIPKKKVEKRIWYKNVKYGVGGVYTSFYYPNFKYKVGDIVDGGKNGIFVYTEKDVLKGMYSLPESVVIKIDPLDAKVKMVDKSNPRKYTIIGKCKVIGVELKENLEKQNSVTLDNLKVDKH